MRFQRGGTFLGFVLGVVVGLAVALVVAIYVTKVPVPFTNKNQQRSVDQDEARKSKDWDPNAPLQGKNPVRPPASVAGPLVVTPPAAPASEVAATPAPKPEVKPEAKPAASADPLGDLARAKAAEGADPFSYFVQAGAYRTPEDAEAQRAKLSLMGIESRVAEREQAGRTVFRVRVGPFDNKGAAEQVQTRLADSGIEAALVRVQR